jgi:hypothetical protein
LRVITCIELGDGRGAVVCYVYDDSLEPIIEKVWFRPKDLVFRTIGMVKAILAGVPWKLGDEIGDEGLKAELMEFGRLALEERLREDALVRVDDVEFWN